MGHIAILPYIFHRETDDSPMDLGINKYVQTKPYRKLTLIFWDQFFLVLTRFFKIPKKRCGCEQAAETCCFPAHSQNRWPPCGKQHSDLIPDLGAEMITDLPTSVPTHGISRSGNFTSYGTAIWKSLVFFEVNHLFLWDLTKKTWGFTSW